MAALNLLSYLSRFTTVRGHLPGVETRLQDRFEDWGIPGMADDRSNQYLTPSQVAAVLHVSPKTVSRWASKGNLPCLVTLGGHRRFRLHDVDNVLLQMAGQEAALSDAAEPRAEIGSGPPGVTAAPDTAGVGHVPSDAGPVGGPLAAWAPSATSD